MIENNFDFKVWDKGEKIMLFWEDIKDLSMEEVFDFYDYEVKTVMGLDLNRKMDANEFLHNYLQNKNSEHDSIHFDEIIDLMERYLEYKYGL